jgi:predicted phage terminase large subunit-like protein
MDNAVLSQKTIKLHRVQLRFLKSEALFRCFCGGIGSGKTFAGSYDLIKRARPDRTYCVVAPSYAQLQDSTFRVFLSVAQMLGVINMQRDVKRGAPPSVRLLTGCEILFRSADNPESLRGSNLSGAWLDEAALMSVDVFNIMLGRLRESSEQGWMSCTTTPKGKSNWVFEVFASGRANTDLIRCRTQDNIFLPRGFSETVAQQYSTKLASQELLGEFIDEDGGMFKRSFFGLVENPPKLVRKIRAWDLASTPSVLKRMGRMLGFASNDPDWSCGALLGEAEDKGFYILHIRRFRLSPQGVEQAVRETAELDGKDVAIEMEQEPGSAGAIVVDHYARSVLRGFNFHAERSTGDKATRAQPFAAAAERGLVKLVAGHWNKDFLDEAELFPNGRHDDQIDAVVRAHTKLAAKLEFWIRVEESPLKAAAAATEAEYIEEVVEDPLMGRSVRLRLNPNRKARNPATDVWPGSTSFRTGPGLWSW